MASTIQSIVSKLNLEMEKQLLQLFPRPVRLHLLCQTSGKGCLSKVQGRFDDVGQFVIIVYLKRGDVRGAYFGKNQNNYENWFLFHLTSEATLIPKQSESETKEDLWKFGDAMKLREEYQPKEGYRVYVDFSSDEKYNTGWAQESMNSNDGSLKELELYRVHEIGDILMYPWRKNNWEESVCEKLRESYVAHKMMSESLNSARVLLLGPAGAGKSSLVNSIRSVMYRRVLHLPIIGTAKDGFTKKLTSYAIRVERGGVSTSLTLCDIPPVGDSDTEGLSYSDTLALINGHITDGYKFGYESPISPTDPCYRTDPKMVHRIHCVAFCLSASDLMSYSEKQKKTYKKLHAAFSALNVPQVILLTHVDQVCHAVSEDVSYVYSSRIVQERMQKAAELLGMPLSYVFPVKNYSWELAVNCHTDILLLTAIQSIQEAVDDTLEDLVDTLTAVSSPATPHTLTGPQELTV